MLNAHWYWTMHLAMQFLAIIECIWLVCTFNRGFLSKWIEYVIFCIHTGCMFQSLTRREKRNKKQITGGKKIIHASEKRINTSHCIVANAKFRLIKGDIKVKNEKNNQHKNVEWDRGVKQGKWNKIAKWNRLGETMLVFLLFRPFLQQQKNFDDNFHDWKPNNNDGAKAHRAGGKPELESNW